MPYETWCNTCDEAKIILTVDIENAETLCEVCDKELEIHGHWSEVAK